MSEYTLITPKQFKERLTRSMDTPIGIHTVYDLVKKKDFPSLKIGGKYYIIEDKVGEWMNAQSTRRKA